MDRVTREVSPAPDWVMLALALLLGQLGGAGSLSGPGEQALSHGALRQMDNFIESLMECRGVPGLQLSVVDLYTGVTTRGYGLADRDRSHPVTPDTHFCVASLTKAFTAILLGKLLARSNYTWDTPVNKILSRPCLFPDENLTSHVTVRDLLLHRTGIPRYDILWYAGVYNRAEILNKIKCMKPQDGLRESSIYNNIMYALAGRVAEELAGGKTWEQLIREEILGPLGMNQSSFYHQRQPSTTDADGFAKQYVNINEETKELNFFTYVASEAIAPAIALCTTGNDMVIWISALLSTLQRQSPQDILPLEVLQEVIKPQIRVDDQQMYVSEIVPPTTPVKLQYDQYGLAWFSGQYEGTRVISHYGSFPGFYSLITLAPTEGFGIFSTINGGDQNRPYTINSLLHTYIMDLLQGKTPWLASRMKSACYFPQEGPTYMTHMSETNKSTPAWRDNKDYEGLYEHRVFGNVTIKTKSQDQTLCMTYGLMEFVMYPKESTMNTDEYYAEATLQDWMVPPFVIQFAVKGRLIYSVTLPFSEKNDDATFVKQSGHHHSELDCVNSVSDGHRVYSVTCLLALLQVVIAALNLC